jgi:hypothetical protein
MVVRPDWAGGSSVNPSKPKPYVPRPSSPGGNTFNTKPRPSSPGGNTHIAPKPIQYYQPAPVNYYKPPTTYSQAPAYNAPPAGSWSQQPVNSGWGGAQTMPYYPPFTGNTPGFGGGGGGGFSSIQNTAPAAPPPPPPPVVGGAKWFSALGPEAKEAEKKKWLGGDSDYAAQIGEYDRALQAFIDRITKQKSLFEQDATDSIATTNKNEGVTLNNLGEDFGARGLSFSGLFDKSLEEGRGRFREARTNIGKIKERNVTDATNREKDYRAENQIGRGNARRAALQRMAAEQALKDANAF